MKNQAEQKVSPDQEELAAKQVKLHSDFINFSIHDRAVIANYLNSYNLTAWIYNELLNDEQRSYIDRSMQLALETQQLDQAVEEASKEEFSGHPGAMDHMIKEINHGE